MAEVSAAVLAKIDEVIKAEGGDKVTNDPVDRGGLTKFGVTQATWTAFRRDSWEASVAHASRAQAIEIYVERFWKAPGYDKVAERDMALAFELFDWGVNSGPAHATKALQRALCALNREGADWSDIARDGVMGRMTLAALDAYRAKRPIRTLIEVVKSLRRVFYIEIAEKNPSQERFVNGWLTRVK